LGGKEAKKGILRYEEGAEQNTNKKGVDAHILTHTQKIHK